MADQDQSYNDNPQEKLLEYQRKFRNLESDRKAYAEETVANIKKQRTIIDKLKNENNQLKDLIAKLTKQNAKVEAMSKTNVNSDNMIEELKQQIEQEKRSQIEIDKNITDFQRKIKEKRLNQGGINAGIETQSALNKQIKILENRLDKANQKFNEAIAINKNLRQSIDSLRRERVIFDNLYKKLEKELHEKRKEMANIIETANTAYEERDKANDSIQNLKQLAKRESADFEKDLRELSQIMEKSKKTYDYIKMTEKNKEENQMNNEIMDADKHQKSRSQFKEKNLTQNNLERIAKFEEDFAKIQAATQIQDFEMLVKFFIQNEEKNFTLFKYVNELSNEIEELEKQIAELREEKEKYEGQGSNIDIQRKKALKELEEKLSKSENKSEQFEYNYSKSQTLINSLKNWIETLFNVIECDKGLSQEQGSNGVSDSNMMAYLGLIEDRVNQILQAFSQVTQQRGTDHIQNMLMNHQNQNSIIGQGKNKMEIPTFTDEMDEDDIEGNKPLTLEEFRLKAQEKLEKKEKAGVKPKIKSQQKQKKR